MNIKNPPCLPTFTYIASSTIRKRKPYSQSDGHAADAWLEKRCTRGNRWKKVSKGSLKASRRLKENHLLCKYIRPHIAKAFHMCVYRICVKFSLKGVLNTTIYRLWCVFVTGRTLADTKDVLAPSLRRNNVCTYVLKRILQCLRLRLKLTSDGIYFYWYSSELENVNDVCCRYYNEYLVLSS